MQGLIYGQCEHDLLTELVCIFEENIFQKFFFFCIEMSLLAYLVFLYGHL